MQVSFSGESRSSIQTKTRKGVEETSARTESSFHFVEKQWPISSANENDRKSCQQSRERTPPLRDLSVR